MGKKRIGVKVAKWLSGVTVLVSAVIPIDLMSFSYEIFNFFGMPLILHCSLFCNGASYLFHSLRCIRWCARSIEYTTNGV